MQRTTVADQVAAAVRDAILTGRYGPGDRLPSERDLAAQFEVNRSSVREALRQLSAWGLVEVRQGGGVTVADVVSQAGLHLLPWLLAPDGDVDADLLRDLLVVRVALLGLTGELAAEHAGPAEVAALEEIVAALATATDRRSVQRLDFAFFAALVRAGGNRVLGMVTSGIARVYEENAERFLALYPEPPMPVVAHRLAVAAVAAGDGAAAREALEAYGGAAFAVLLERSDT